MSNQHCYIKVDTPMKVTAARRHCEHQHSAHLATVTGPEENEFVRTLLATNRSIAGDYMIGYTDVGVTTPRGEWEWIKGELGFTATMGKYETWNDGQPNGNLNEHCATMNSASGNWDDVACAGEHKFVCETNKF